VNLLTQEKNNLFVYLLFKAYIHIAFDLSMVIDSSDLMISYFT